MEKIPFLRHPDDEFIRLPYNPKNSNKFAHYLTFPELNRKDRTKKFKLNAEDGDRLIDQEDRQWLLKQMTDTIIPNLFKLKWKDVLNLSVPNRTTVKEAGMFKN